MCIQHLALSLSCFWSYREQFFTREYDVGCGFFTDALYWVEGVPFSFLLGVFVKRRYWILSNGFILSVETIVWVLPFMLLMWYLTLTDFQMLSQFCTSGINPTWSWYIILLIHCWILFSSVLLYFVLVWFSGVLSVSQSVSDPLLDSPVTPQRHLGNSLLVYPGGNF